MPAGPGIGSGRGRGARSERLEARGEDGGPDRFDHEHGDGGGFRANQGFGRRVGLGRNLAELAILMRPGVERIAGMAMRRAEVAEQAEQVQREGADQEPAGSQRESGESVHTWAVI